jgi:hypothetical protein
VIVALLFTQDLLAAQPEAARETSAKSVGVLPSHCAAWAQPFAAFLDSLRVELAGAGVSCCAANNPSDGRAPGPDLLVAIGSEPCVPDPGHFSIRVDGADQTSGLRRDLSLDDVAPSARPRALALAVAESIRSLPHNTGASKPKAPAASGVVPLVHSPPVSPWALSFSGGLEWRGYPAYPTTIWGGRVALAVARRFLHADFDVGAGRGRRSVELGTIGIRMASAGLAVGPRLWSGGTVVDLGVRGEVGWAWIDGEPGLPGVRAGSGSSLIAAMGLHLTYEPLARKPVHPRVSIAGGAVLGSVKAEANGSPQAGLSAAYLLASVGVASSAW